MPRRHPVDPMPPLRAAPLLALAGALLLAASAVAAERDPSPSPLLPGLIPPGAVIGEVRIVNGDIFDPHQPGEDRWLFRTANRIHRETRVPVIARQLLF